MGKRLSVYCWPDQTLFWVTPVSILMIVGKMIEQLGNL